MAFKAIFVCPKNNHQLRYAKLMGLGLQKHGITDIQIVPYFDPKIMDANLVATWAYRAERQLGHWALIKKAQIENNGKFLIMERAYVGDRFNWVSLGYGGLNGNADFCNSDITDSTRWNKHFPNELKEWRPQGKNVLVVGQCLHDASISHIDIEKWYSNTIKELTERGNPVIFRPHPMNHYNWSDSSLQYKRDSSETFEECLNQNIRCVVTFNSNAGVLSTLAGVPTITCDKGSMAYNITKHDLTDLDYRPDRSLWAAQLAYTQWLPEELESGEAFEHLKKKFL